MIHCDASLLYWPDLCFGYYSASFTPYASWIDLGRNKTRFFTFFLFYSTAASYPKDEKSFSIHRKGGRFILETMHILELWQQIWCNFVLALPQHSCKTIWAGFYPAPCELCMIYLTSACFYSLYIPRLDHDTHLSACFARGETEGRGILELWKAASVTEEQLSNVVFSAHT